MEATPRSASPTTLGPHPLLQPYFTASGGFPCLPGRVFSLICGAATRKVIRSRDAIEVGRRRRDHQPGNGAAPLMRIAACISAHVDREDLPHCSSRRRPERPSCSRNDNRSPPAENRSTFFAKCSFSQAFKLLRASAICCLSHFRLARAFRRRMVSRDRAGTSSAAANLASRHAASGLSQEVFLGLA